MKIKFCIVTAALLCLLTEARTQSVDVDLYTGQPVVQVPLWTIRSGDLSHHLGISFSASGVKTGLAAVKQFGMGWNFAFAGTIFREVRGIPDELLQTTAQPYRHGWLHQNTAQTIGNFIPTADDNLLDCSDEDDDYNFLNGLGGFSSTGTIKDTEPDLFTISAPGISVSFVFDHNGQIKTISDSDLIITKADNTLTAFSVTTDRGVVYTFELPETGTINTLGQDSKVEFRKHEYFSNKGSIPYKKVWKLTQIIAPSGDFIKFEYKTISNAKTLSDGTITVPQSFTAYLTENKYLSTTGTDSIQSVYNWTQSLSAPALPFRITTKQERVDIEINDILFPTGSYYLRHPLITALRVTSLRESSEELVRLFKFNYIPTEGNLFGSFEQGVLHEDNVVLRSVSESSFIESFQPIVFDYYGISFYTVSNGQQFGTAETASGDADEYGFTIDNNHIYTGNYKAHVYPSLQGPDRFRINPIVGYPGDYFISAGDLSRESSQPMQTGMLRYVRQSNGSINRIFYEPNSYYDSLSGISVYAGGLRVSRTELHDGVNYANDIVKTYDYTKEDGQSSGVLIFKPERNFNLNFYKPKTGNDEYFENMTALTQKEKWKRISRITNQVLNDDSNPGINVAYKRVTVKQSGAGKSVYEFSIPVPYGKTSHGSWQATKTRFARETPSAATAISNCSSLSSLGTYYAYPFAPNPNYEFRQGQLTTVTLYNESGQRVQRTENEYSIISNPVKVYGIRLDKFKSPATITVELNGVPTQSSSLVNMFVYSRYEINTGTRSRLTRVRNYSYDKDNPSAYVLNENQIQYGSSYHKYATHSIQTNSDGVELHTEMKYPKDYSITSAWANQDISTKAITRLKEKNIVAMPIETVSWRKDGSSEIISGGSIQLFDYIEQKNRVDIVKNLSVNPGKVKGSYNFSQVINSGGSSSFTYDSAYARYIEFANQDEKGNARTTIKYDKSKSAVHYDATGTVPRVVISNASADEVVFSDFESKDEFDFQYTASAWGSNPVFDAGRIAGNSLRLLAGSSYKISAQTKKGIAKSHIFSCWAKSTATSTVTVKVLDGVHTAETKIITIPNTLGQWQYFSVSIPTSSFNSTITIEAETNAFVLLDDVAFHPASSSIAHYLYNRRFNKIAETTNGLSSTFVYDGLDRLQLVRDHYGNILKNITYGVYEVALEDRGIEISKDSEYVNEPVTFTAKWFNAPGVTYKWKLVTLANKDDAFNFTGAVSVTGTNTWSHTFTQSGYWYLNVEVTYGTIVRSLSYPIEVNIVHRPLQITLCSNRPLLLDACNPNVFDNSCTPFQNEGLNLSASVLNGVGTLTFQWGYQAHNSNVLIYPFVQMTQTGSSVNISDFVWSRVYTVTVTDSNGTTTGAQITFQTYQSDPECENPNQN